MTASPKDLKTIVKHKYSEIAQQNTPGCCGPDDCCGSDDAINIMDKSYEGLEGYNPDADLKLGCGIPIDHAGLQEGQRVLDLGSGAGNDLFVARRIVGDSGWLTGIDFSDEMNEKAEANRRKMGYTNMEFLSGDIEAMPLSDQAYDVVLSNCVLNLVPDKQAAYSEIFRVLKPGGHFTISDIVTEGVMDEQLKQSAELYAGCITGAIGKSEYLDIVKQTGFERVEVKEERNIAIPQDWLNKYAGPGYSADDIQIQSVTVIGFKP